MPFPSIWHNEVRDLTATLLTEVCHDVCVEPDLQPLTGEQMNNATAITDAGARLDMGLGGDTSKGHLLTFEFSTHMLNSIGIARSLHAIGNTKGLKRGHTNKEFVRWSMPHSPHWFWLQQVEWPMKLHISLKD